MMIILARHAIYLMDLMRSHPMVLPEPETIMDVLELADSSVNLAVRPRVQVEDCWRVRSDLMEQVKLRFDEAGINIPYPQQDIHLYQSVPQK